MNHEERPALSVVVPVFNQAASIVGNLEVIRRRVGEVLGEPFEIVVVSDGSIDSTEDELIMRAPAGSVRVFHYDRNLGKGYAVKLGSLEARGDWIGFVDADLDLDPASLATYVEHARRNDLDFAIGSKRHPNSFVRYPRIRVVASWMFQQFVRLLFRLNVKDTQVGLKLFRREVADQVLPLLLVKRYAFDIELLAVARAFGFTRIEEMPIRLDYQFTGSGVRSRAVVRALVDTLAIFYRLRILRYYQRRRRLSGAYGFTRPRTPPPSVSVLLPEGVQFRERDFPAVEVLPVAPDGTLAPYRRAAADASGELLAILEPGVRAAGNWLSAATPFLVRPEICAVVVPKVAPATGSHRTRAAAAIVESRVGGGLGYFRHTPGNLRYVNTFPAAGIVIRKSALLAAPADVALSELVAAVHGPGGRVLYTPETVVVADPAPLFAPHLRAVWHRAVSYGRSIRKVTPWFSLRGSVGLGGVLLIIAALLALNVSIDVGFAMVVGGIYLLALVIASTAAMLRYQSVKVGALSFVGTIATHLVQLAGFARGLVVG